jgi:hypothetical protein
MQIVLHRISYIGGKKDGWCNPALRVVMIGESRGVAMVVGRRV